MNIQFEGVTVTQDNAVAIVSFSRPPNNYFDVELINALAETLEGADRQPEIRAVLLRSEGKVFCAGAKFSGREGGGAGASNSGDLSDPSELYRKGVRLFRTRKPIIAEIQGPAIGGGLGLSMIADFRVVAPEARFAGNFVKIGIHPGFGLTHTLPRAIGHQLAAMLLYTGRRIDGEEAARIGLADVLAPLQALHETALGLAQEIAENAPLALEATRQTLRAGLADAVARQTDLECREQISLFRTEDFKEGVKAVAERRPGRWVRA
jgi:enoyl-CoA hydratase/carnithine racemase